MEIKFIADNNVGKLARWLRMIGYDTTLLRQKDDAQMIKIALGENRVILTKDAQFMKRRLVTNGSLKTVHIDQDDPKLQVQEVVKTLALDYHFRPFSLCLECNEVLVARDKENVKNLVPAHVFETQSRYTQCPACHRVYWPGTHWQAMVKRMEGLHRGGSENHAST
ncbi:MAG: Mut7-C RNAse domain-containing protein [Dehalococcoidia bacterium]|nr:Mut7-C RNAse domain-containing protein [Dehalococcoidia bacterium]MDH4299649.1 Mut7-C RNAse domain-containing protein [Dehalococcoidia bacterium]